ncbi:reverse transcriptase domain-containing protein [Tanacetum coccineum]
MDAMTIKMVAQYKELQSHAKQPTSYLDDADIPMSREEEAKFMQTFYKTHFYNDYRDQDSNCDNWRSSGRNDYNRDNYQSNTDDKPYDLQQQFNDFLKSQQSTNAFVNETFMDLKTQLETVATNHQASIQNLETKFDKLADKQSGRPSGSLPSNTQPNPRGRISKAYQPPQAHNEHVNSVFTISGKSYNPPKNPNEEQKKTENPINSDSEDEDDEPTPQPKIQTQKPVKETPLPKHTNQKFPDLGAGINLMPYYLYAKLSLETLKPTKMSVRLADGSFQYPVGIAENMLVEVGKFTFPVDFVILEMKEDIGTERIIFNIDSAMKHSYSYDETCFSIDVINEILEEDFDALLDEESKILHSIEGTLTEEENFSEFNEFIAMAEEENYESESDTEEPPFKKSPSTQIIKSRYPLKNLIRILNSNLFLITWNIYS